MKNNTNIISQSELTRMLKDVENQKSYYVGGGLCIDYELVNGYKGIVGIHLTGEYGDFINGGSEKMNDENLMLAYQIYKKHKGETAYYKECRNKSIVKCLEVKEKINEIKNGSY